MIDQATHWRREAQLPLREHGASASSCSRLIIMLLPGIWQHRCHVFLSFSVTTISRTAARSHEFFCQHDTRGQYLALSVGFTFWVSDVACGIFSNLNVNGCMQLYKNSTRIGLTCPFSRTLATIRIKSIPTQARVHAEYFRRKLLR